MAIVGKVFNSFNNCPVLVRRGLKKAVEDPVSAAAMMSVLSVVSKDFIQCFFYTYQSWNNKKIPSAKRKFIACSDVTNCILMVGGQLLLFKKIEDKFQPWLNGKIFKGEYDVKKTGKSIKVNSDIPFKKGFFSQVYSGDSIREYAQDMLKNNPKYKELTAEQAENITKLVIKKCQKHAKAAQIITGLGLIVTWFGTIAIVKRALAPLLSIPSAAWLEKKVVKFIENREARKRGEPVYSRQGVIV